MIRTTAHAVLMQTFIAAALAAAGAPPQPAAASVRPAVAVTVEAGSTVHAAVTVVVLEGYHVQANPPSQEYLIPTKLDFTSLDGFALGKIGYPKPQIFRLQGDELATYTGTFAIDVPLTAAPTLQPGDYVLKGTLRYQACDARSCYAPTRISVELPVKVTAAKPAGAKSSS